MGTINGAAGNQNVKKPEKIVLTNKSTSSKSKYCATAEFVYRPWRIYSNEILYIILRGTFNFSSNYLQSGPTWYRNVSVGIQLMPKCSSVRPASEHITNITHEALPSSSSHRNNVCKNRCSRHSLFCPSASLLLPAGPGTSRVSLLSFPFVVDSSSLSRLSPAVRLTAVLSTLGGAVQGGRATVLQCRSVSTASRSTLRENVEKP